MPFQSAIPQFPKKGLSRLEKMPVEKRIARAELLTEPFTSKTNRISSLLSEGSSQAQQIGANPGRCAKAWHSAYLQLSELNALRNLGALDRNMHWFKTRFHSTTERMLQACLAQPIRLSEGALGYSWIKAGILAYPVSWLLAQVSTAISEAAEAPLISMAPILANCWALYKTMHAIVAKDIRSTIGYQISILGLVQDYLAECDKPE